MQSRSLIVATAGHVDHGKTSLVKHLTGIDTDTLLAEKERGLTINLGYAYHHFQHQDEERNISCTLGFVDVPGHTDFINNMTHEFKTPIATIDLALSAINNEKIKTDKSLTDKSVSYTHLTLPTNREV